MESKEMKFTAKEYKQIRDCIKILDKKPIKASDVILMNKLLDTEYLYFEIPETGEVYMGLGAFNIRTATRIVEQQNRLLKEPLKHLLSKMVSQIQEDINEAYFSDDWVGVYNKYQISLKINGFRKYVPIDRLQEIFCLPVTSLPDESIFTFIDYAIGSKLQFWHIRAFDATVNRVVCSKEELNEELKDILIDFFEVKQYE